MDDKSNKKNKRKRIISAKECEIELGSILTKLFEAYGDAVKIILASALSVKLRPILVSNGLVDA